jgi:hypothetical protein
MTIFINDKKADIMLEAEKTLGDIMSGLEQWISPTGNRIQRISINDETVPDESMNEAFSREINNIKKINISICSWRELAAEALDVLHKLCVVYNKAGFDERKEIIASWENSYAARFLITDIPDIYNLAAAALSGQGLEIQEFCAIIEERLNEVVSPDLEILNLEELVMSIAKRMEELPLDIQTGKDASADQTILLFSRIGEKLFRLFFIYKTDGLSVDDFIVDGKPFKAFMSDFNSALSDLSQAYESRDTVLIGDAAEYELAPRLIKFFAALNDVAKSYSPVASAS